MGVNQSQEIWFQIQTMLTSSLVTLDMSVFVFISFIGMRSLTFFHSFVPWLVASFASLATWSLLFHLSLLLISLWSSAQNILIMPKLIYLLRNEASGELFESVLRLHIHRIWFSESSLGPRNLSFYKHLIGIWCRWSFEKHWFRTFIYFIFYKKL